MHTLLTVVRKAPEQGRRGLDHLLLGRVRREGKEHKLDTFLLDDGAFGQRKGRDVAERTQRSIDRVRRARYFTRRRNDPEQWRNRTRSEEQGFIRRLNSHGLQHSGSLRSGGFD